MSAGDVYQDSGAWKVELTIRHQGGVIMIFRLKSAEDSMAAGKLALNLLSFVLKTCKSIIVTGERTSMPH